MMPEPSVEDARIALDLIVGLEKDGVVFTVVRGQPKILPGKIPVTAEQLAEIKRLRDAVLWLLGGPSPAEIAASDKSDASGKRQIFPRNTQPQTLSDLIAPAKEESET